MVKRLLEVEACLMSLASSHDAPWISWVQMRDPRGTWDAIFFQLPLVVIFIITLAIDPQPLTF